MIEDKKELKQVKGKELYKKVLGLRKSLEPTWRDCAQLTLPYIFPQTDNHNQSDILPTPYNSIGSSSVNVLASKLLVALLPPSGVFFRLLPDSKVTKDLSPDEENKLDSELSDIEQEVIEMINQQALRVPVFEAVKLLIVTGNVAMYKVKNGTFKVFSPYQYVVQRDYIGNLLYAVIKEKISWEVLPEKVQEQIEAKEGLTEETNDTTEGFKQVDIYTTIMREETKYIVKQEVAGIVIEGTIKTYSEQDLPYLFLRWNTVNNESYGRGLVEQYLGDLRSLEGLTQTIVEGSGISAMHLFGLRAGSTLKVEDLNNTRNGQFVLGDLEREVSTLQVNKTADLQVPLKLMEMLEQRIAKAFLVLGGQIRDSERTTAAEVRATVAELESTLGGIFSVLANEFQKPLITLMLKELSPDALKVATPSITTGISAISRERDFQNLNTMLQSVAQLGGDVLTKYMNIDRYLAEVATALGVSSEGLIKTPEQIQQEEQQQMQLQQQQVAQQQQLEGFKAGMKGGK